MARGAADPEELKRKALVKVFNRYACAQGGGARGLGRDELSQALGELGFFSIASKDQGDVLIGRLLIAMGGAPVPLDRFQAVMSSVTNARPATPSRSRGDASGGGTPTPTPKREVGTQHRRPQPYSPLTPPPAPPPPRPPSPTIGASMKTSQVKRVQVSVAMEPVREEDDATGVDVSALTSQSQGADESHVSHGWEIHDATDLMTVQHPSGGGSSAWARHQSPPPAGDDTPPPPQRDKLSLPHVRDPDLATPPRAGRQGRGEVAPSPASERYGVVRVERRDPSDDEATSAPLFTTRPPRQAYEEYDASSPAARRSCSSPAAGRRERGHEADSGAKSYAGGGGKKENAPPPLRRAASASPSPQRGAPYHNQSHARDVHRMHTRSEERHEWRVARRKEAFSEYHPHNPMGKSPDQALDLYAASGAAPGRGTSPRRAHSGGRVSPVASPPPLREQQRQAEAGAVVPQQVEGGPHRISLSPVHYDEGGDRASHADALSPAAPLPPPSGPQGGGGGGGLRGHFLPLPVAAIATPMPVMSVSPLTRLPFAALQAQPDAAQRALAALKGGWPPGSVPAVHYTAAVFSGVVVVGDSVVHLLTNMGLVQHSVPLAGISGIYTAPNGFVGLQCRAGKGLVWQGEANGREPLLKMILEAASARQADTNLHIAHVETKHQFDQLVNAHAAGTNTLPVTIYVPDGASPSPGPPRGAVYDAASPGEVHSRRYTQSPYGGTVTTATSATSETYPSPATGAYHRDAASTAALLSQMTESPPRTRYAYQQLASKDVLWLEQLKHSGKTGFVVDAQWEGRRYRISMPHGSLASVKVGAIRRTLSKWVSLPVEALLLFAPNGDILDDDAATGGMIKLQPGDIFVLSKTTSPRLSVTPSPLAPRYDGGGGARDSPPRPGQRAGTRSPPAAGRPAAPPSQEATQIIALNNASDVTEPSALQYDPRSADAPRSPPRPAPEHELRGERRTVTTSVTAHHGAAITVVHHDAPPPPQPPADPPTRQPSPVAPPLPPPVPNSCASAPAPAPPSVVTYVSTGAASAQDAHEVAPQGSARRPQPPQPLPSQPRQEWAAPAAAPPPSLPQLQQQPNQIVVSHPAAPRQLPQGAPVQEDRSVWDQAPQAPQVQVVNVAAPQPGAHAMPIRTPSGMGCAPAVVQQQQQQQPIPVPQHQYQYMPAPQQVQQVQYVTAPRGGAGFTPQINVHGLSVPKPGVAPQVQVVNAAAVAGEPAWALPQSRPAQTAHDMHALVQQQQQQYMQHLSRYQQLQEQLARLEGEGGGTGSPPPAPTPPEPVPVYTAKPAPPPPPPPPPAFANSGRQSGGVPGVSHIAMVEENTSSVFEAERAVKEIAMAIGAQQPRGAASTQQASAAAMQRMAARRMSPSPPSRREPAEATSRARVSPPAPTAREYMASRGVIDGQSSLPSSAPPALTGSGLRPAAHPSPHAAARPAVRYAPALAQARDFSPGRFRLAQARDVSPKPGRCASRSPGTEDGYDDDYRPSGRGVVVLEF